MEGKKNYFQAENADQAKKIVRRMKAAGFSPKGIMNDDFFKGIPYPCRFYNNSDDQIILDYEPFGGWKSYKEFVGSWMERANCRKQTKKIS